MPNQFVDLYISCPPFWMHNLECEKLKKFYLRFGVCDAKTPVTKFSNKCSLKKPFFRLLPIYGTIVINNINDCLHFYSFIS